MLGAVAVLVGHDDDVVLGPTGDAAADRRERSSRWAGLQSDRAIVASMRAACPSLDVRTIDTVEELRATDADVVVVVSYKTQPGYGWYARFFGALRELEARGVAVYPSADFKELISCKGAYARVLQAAQLPLCPTEVIDRSECTDAAGAVQPQRLAARMQSALQALGLVGSAPAALRLVTKPSNADGGFGVAFWEASVGDAPPARSAEGPAVAENVALQGAKPPVAGATARGGVVCADEA